jgi:hypothetical protein
MSKPRRAVGGVLRRWIVYAISGVCALLTLGTLGLWIRSYWWRDSLGYTQQPERIVFDLSTDPGRLTLWVNGSLSPHSIKTGWMLMADRYAELPPSMLPKVYPIFSTDFCWDKLPSYFGRTMRFVWCPFWALAGTLALASAMPFLLRVCRRARFHQGLCQNCGYDLRASPERCPECGTARNTPSEGAKS